MPCYADPGYEVVHQMLAFLNENEIEEAKDLARRVLRQHGSAGYDRDVHARDDQRKKSSSAQRKSQQFRRQLFSQASPARLLEPVNIVAVYLVDHTMWKTWNETHDINTRMLPFVQGLYPADPLPNDPRLALPITVAGVYLLHALGLPSDLPKADLAAEVYRDVAEALVVISRLPVPDRLADDFAHTRDTANLLLLHAVRLGLDAWDHGLILRCRLGAQCLQGQPFYVVPPKTKTNTKTKTDPYHPACRQAAGRAPLRLVTTTKTKDKK